MVKKKKKIDSTNVLDSSKSPHIPLRGEVGQLSRAGNRIARFLSKNEPMRDLLKKMSDSLLRSFLVSEMSDSLISSERPERITHGCSFLVNKMSNSLTSLIWFEQNEGFTRIAHQKRENEPKWAICSFFQKKIFKPLKKHSKTRFEIFLAKCFWANRSFAHFWWEKWAIRSHRSFPLSDLSESLICLEGSERIANSRSFDLSKRKRVLCWSIYYKFMVITLIFSLIS